MELESHSFGGQLIKIRPEGVFIDGSTTPDPYYASLLRTL